MVETEQPHTHKHLKLNREWLCLAADAADASQTCSTIQCPPSAVREHLVHASVSSHYRYKGTIHTLRHLLLLLATLQRQILIQRSVHDAQCQNIDTRVAGVRCFELLKPR